VTLQTAKAAPEGAGDCWTWTAIDENKLILTWLIGSRDGYAAELFLTDLRARVEGRIQLTTDGHTAYPGAVGIAFGNNVDFAQLVKRYGDAPDHGPERRYSPGVCVGADKVPVRGNPDLAHVSTSYVEKHNQTMRQHMKRFARLTAAHSKKIENHCHMVALYTVWYKFARINSAVRMAPAVAAGLSDTLWDVGDIVKLVDAAELQQAA
jgi:IS1 family transposase